MLRTVKLAAQNAQALRDLALPIRATDNRQSAKRDHASVLTLNKTFTNLKLY